MGSPILACVIAALGFFCWEARDVDTSLPAATIVEDNNAFALDLYARLSHGEGNRFISPFSISCALAMTYAGARGETAAQIASALHFTLGPAELHPAFHRLLTELHSRNESRAQGTAPPDVQLFTANALWTQTGKHILADFQKHIEINYQGGLYPVDFHAAPEEARNTINAWVEEQTKNKIKDLLKSTHIDSNTVAILTNAIYFKALWSRPFSPSMTAPADFHASTGAKVKVDMMKQTERLPYCEDDTFQALELPYKGDSLVMTIVLPRSIDGLANLEKALSTSKLKAVTGKLSPVRVQVSLPKFKMTQSCELKTPLAELGMPLAFKPGSADFSGITGTRELAISDVVHQAFIAVDEHGTEAAAATATVFARAAMVVAPPLVFRADHPFLFLIRDTRSGSILFLGRLVKP
jgi:serpin B